MCGHDLASIRQCHPQWIRCRLFVYHGGAIHYKYLCGTGIGNGMLCGEVECTPGNLCLYILGAQACMVRCDSRTIVGNVCGWDGDVIIINIRCFSCETVVGGVRRSLGVNIKWC
jgi:hypothetical protein